MAICYAAVCSPRSAVFMYSDPKRCTWRIRTLPRTGLYFFHAPLKWFRWVGWVLLRSCRWGKSIANLCAATPGCRSAWGARRRWRAARPAPPAAAAALAAPMAARTSLRTTPRRTRRPLPPIAPDCHHTQPPMWVPTPRHRRTITTTWLPPLTIRIFR